MRAPIRVRGSMILCIGRVLREASPVSVVVKACAATTPASRRIVVPLLRQSSGPAG
jgi:hypothetical protein